MKNKVLIFFLIGISGLFLLVIGYYVGVLVQKPQIDTLEKIKILSTSKVIHEFSVFAYGTVTNISDRKITLTSLTPEKESLEIPISSDAKVTAYIFPENIEEGKPITPEQKEISFGEIKIDNRANITIKIKPDGQFEGINVIVLPQ